MGHGRYGHQAMEPAKKVRTKVVLWSGREPLSRRLQPGLDLEIDAYLAALSTWLWVLPIAGVDGVDFSNRAKAMLWHVLFKRE